MQLNELLSCKNLKYEKSINLHKLISFAGGFIFRFSARCYERANVNTSC